MRDGNCISPIRIKEVVPFRGSRSISLPRDCQVDSQRELFAPARFRSENRSVKKLAGRKT